MRARSLSCGNGRARSRRCRRGRRCGCCWRRRSCCISAATAGRRSRSSAPPERGWALNGWTWRWERGKPRRYSSRSAGRGTGAGRGRITRSRCGDNAKIKLMKITPGKLKGMNAVANARGVIAAAAMDQRGSLQKSLAQESGKAATAAMLEEFKVAVSRALTPHASAILLDPEYGLPAAKARDKRAGLLLAYEESGYDNTQPGRLP